MIEVLVKGLPKNIDEAVIKCWYFEEGDRVTKGDDLVELVTADEVTVVITVPSKGVVAEVYFDEGETVQRDEVICLIDPNERKLKDAEADGDEDDDKDDSSDDEENDDDY